MGKLIRQEAFIFFGIIMVIGTLFKLLGIVYIDSDWFWFLAGIAIIFEGTIDLLRQKRFDNKYKVLSREEYQKLIDKK